MDVFKSGELEGLEARGLPTPVEPTKAEVEWHNLTHVPHAPWCSVCVRGRGRDSRHEAQGAEARADCESWSYIQVDYFFMKYREEDVAQPYLSAVDSKYGRCMAVKCVTKGKPGRVRGEGLGELLPAVGRREVLPTVGPRALHPGRGGQGVRQSSRRHGSDHPQAEQTVFGVGGKISWHRRVRLQGSFVEYPELL